MGFKPGTRSNVNLLGVHPKLQAVVKLAFSKLTYPATVIEGVRNQKRQDLLLSEGHTKVRTSKHQIQKKSGWGEAVDIIPDGKDPWNNKVGFEDIRKCMIQAAKELNVKILYGADWDMDGKTAAEGDKDEKFVDKPHWEYISD